MGEGLFEIRARGVEGIGRAFFCTLVGRRIVILHSFIKKTQKTPKKYMVSSLFARIDQIFHGASPQALHLERLFSNQRGPKPRTITKR